MSNAAESYSTATTTSSSTSSSTTVIQDGVAVQLPKEVPVLTGVRNPRGIPQIMYLVRHCLKECRKCNVAIDSMLLVVTSEYGQVLVVSIFCMALTIFKNPN